MPDALRVLVPGISAVTDLGRPHAATFGISSNGALDQFATRMANALVGNSDSAPVIEITATGFAAEALTTSLYAFTGSDATIEVDGIGRTAEHPLLIEAGQHIEIRDIRGGIRVYMSISGGFIAPTLLGSCAPDLGLRFGWHLKQGDIVSTRETLPMPLNPQFGQIFVNPVRRVHASSGSPRVLNVVDGPDISEFGSTSARLFDGPYTIDPRSNNVGFRLHGSLPSRQFSTEVLSKGVPIGAVEVPSDDALLILHRGRGVTAGFAVVAVVTTASLDMLGQASPGESVFLRKQSVTEAIQEHKAQLATAERIRSAVRSAIASLREESFALSDGAEWPV